MSDNRTIVGIFLCTDCHRNIILGSSLEYLKDGFVAYALALKLVPAHFFFLSTLEENEEPRMLGLAMIPGEHIVSIHVDEFMPKPDENSTDPSS